MHVLEALERELLQNSTRRNAERVSQLLADNFREFGGSGKIYSKSEIIAALQRESPVDIALSNFEEVALTPEVTLVTYKATKRNADRSVTDSLRSSIWISEAGHWRMLFHQGTILPGKAL